MQYTRLETRHMVMQVLAWMWCTIFSMWCSSITVFGISTLAHTLLIAGIAITVGTFKLGREQTIILYTKRWIPQYKSFKTKYVGKW